MKDLKLDTSLKGTVFTCGLKVSFFMYQKRMVKLLRFALKPVKEVKLDGAIWA